MLLYNLINKCCDQARYCEKKKIITEIVKVAANSGTITRTSLTHRQRRDYNSNDSFEKCDVQHYYNNNNGRNGSFLRDWLPH